MVIPKIHVPDFWAAPEEVARDVAAGALRVGRAIRKALAPQGLNLITSAGAVAEQTMFHLHLHVVPRWANDNFGEIWPTSRRYEDASLENVADRVRQACTAE